MKATTEVDYIKVEDNLEGVVEFIGQEVELKDGSFNFKSLGTNWRVTVGDCIVKNPIGFLVYKPERFEKDFKVKKPEAKKEVTEEKK